VPVLVKRSDDLSGYGRATAYARITNAILLILAPENRLTEWAFSITVIVEAQKHVTE